MHSILRNILHDQSGQDTLEYALIAAVIGLCAIASLNSSDSSLAKALKSITKSVKKNA